MVIQTLRDSISGLQTLIATTIRLAHPFVVSKKRVECPIGYKTCENLGVPHAKAIIQVIAKPSNIPCSVKAFVMHYLDSCRRTLNEIFGQGIFLEQSITLLKAPNTSHTLFYLNDVLHT